MPSILVRQAEKAVREPSRRMSASFSLSATSTIFLRICGSCEATLSENVGRFSSGCGVIMLSVLSMLSGDDFDNCDDLMICLLWWLLMEIHASFASWKRVLMVMPVPWERKQRLYWVSVSCGL